MNYNNRLSSKLEEFNKNRQNNYKNYIQESAKKNKTYNNNNTNNRASKNKKIKNINYNNSNTIYKNFSNLSESLNKYKKAIYNSKNSNITYTNKNNSGIVKPRKNKINSMNILVKSNNNERKRMKRKINKNINKTINNNQLKTNNFINTNKNSNKNININNSKPQVRHGKNKTFDFNTINQNDPISKYNSNNNIDKFKVLFSSNNKNNPKKKINSKFNLIKKPIYEVMKNPILSPQIKKVNNKIATNQSISQNKEKKKKIFYGLSNHSNNYNIQQSKLEHDSPKAHHSNKKKNSMTFSSEDNKIDNLNIEGIAKKNKRGNISKNKKQIKKNNNINLNKFDSIKEPHNNNIINNSNSNNNSNNYKIKTTSISPLSNYSTNFNKNTKNINYSSGNNTLKNDNSSSNNNNSEALKSTKIINNINLNTNIENISNNNKTINGELLDDINMTQNDNCVISRNKKQNNSKISSTQSQNEMVKELKSIKNLKANCIGSKIHIKNMTCCNDSNLIMPKYNINYNLGKINSSTEVKNIHIKDMLFKLNKISIKKKAKKSSQRVSKKKDKIKFYIKPKNKYNRGILSGDNIFNRKKIIEIKQNSLHLNSRTTHKDNNNVKSNNTISHRERGNSLQIINVNRNINLINKKDRKNLQKLTKI